MDLNNYIDTIVFYVISAVAALGGTSIGIGTICGWVKRIIVQAVEKLTSTKGDYDKDATKLKDTANKLENACDKMTAVGNTLTEFAKEISQMKSLSDESINKMNTLAQVLAIMVQQNEFMVANGTAKQCVDMISGCFDNADVGEVISDE
mgnify:CR=1 FL=1